LIVQAALSVVLLVGAGLFLRSMVNVKNIPFGYDGDRLLWVDLEWRGVEVDSIQGVQKRAELVERAKTIPGVERVSRALTVPFWMTWQLSLFVPGIDSVSKLGDFTMQAGSPEFFETMGTRVVRGRGITSEDRSSSPLVMVVSEAMAKKLWPNEDPIGKATSRRCRYAAVDHGRRCRARRPARQPHRARTFTTTYQSNSSDPITADCSFGRTERRLLTRIRFAGVCNSSCLVRRT
jgi:hypothetical protein